MGDKSPKNKEKKKKKADKKAPTQTDATITSIQSKWFPISNVTAAVVAFFPLLG